MGADKSVKNVEKRIIMEMTRLIRKNGTKIINDEYWILEKLIMN